MKFLLTLSVLLIAANIVLGKPTADEIAALMADFEKSAVSCQGKVAATADDLEELLHKKMPSTMEGKCLHACLMKHFNLMDDKGKFSKMAFENMINKITHNDVIFEVVEKMAEVCNKEPVPDNECEAAFIYYKCLLAQGKLHNIENLISV